jgi:hypothetical protein
LVLAAPTFAGQSQGVEFIDLGTFGDTYPFGISITADGTRVGGSQEGGLFNCIVWDESTGEWSILAASDDICYMSRDGLQFGSANADIVGVEHMSRYNPVTMQMEFVNEVPELDNCDFFQSATYGISGDGYTLVGLGWAGCSSARAISSFDDCAGGGCVPGGVMTRYESWVEGRANRMNGSDGDGDVLVGWQDTESSARLGAVWYDGVGDWIPGGGQEGLDIGVFVGEAYRTNPDGSTIVGGNYNSADTGGIREGWVFDTDGVRPTGQLPGAFFLDAGFNFAVSEDGRTAGGRFGFGPFSSATLWTETTGIINLNQFLIDQGRTEPFDGWFMVQINDISGTGAENDVIRLVVWAANPDFFLGNQTVLIDISKVKVCHAPPGNPANQRTLVISWGSVEEHVGHGDFLGSCEVAFARTARARSATEHFGIDPANECTQNALNEFMATRSPILAVSIDAMERMFTAAEDCEGL